MSHALPRHPRDRALLALAALGVVYGDIGTSPLYTWNEIHHTGLVEHAADVLGATSLVVWTLTLAIAVKYVVLVLRADNHGEGGTFALAGLVRDLAFPGKTALLAALTFAACLLYADGLLTPAISVVSALEGLAVADPRLEPAILPGALVVLTGLFAIQRAGTARLGYVFGAVCVVWFLAIGGLGLASIVETPGILLAVSPHHALRYVSERTGAELMPLLGAVVLAITGGEALYADIGHFGVATVRLAWNVLVLPSLLLSYLGQGAALLAERPLRGGNVFYTLVPEDLVGPMVLLSSAAAVIASQALVSGAFSLTRSAISLGLVPPVAVRHTSAQVEGQIYLPAVNVLLWVGCCALVLVFRTSAGLAAAYGLAVMGVVTTTTLALVVVARRLWGWSVARTAVVFVPFLAFDLVYLGANVIKIPDGAWVPLAFGGALYLAMWNWSDGRARLRAAHAALPPVPLRDVLRREGRTLLPRAFVFLVSSDVRTPDDPAPVLLRTFVDRYGAVPEHLTLFTVAERAEVPYWRGQRFEVSDCGEGVVAVRMSVGFMEQPDVRAALTWLKTHRRIRLHAHRWTLVSGDDEFLFQAGAPARLRAFAWLKRASSRTADWFGLSADPGLSKEVVPVLGTADGAFHLQAHRG